MREHLPDWITMGKRTMDFFKWLENGGESIEVFSNIFFVKGTMQDCVIIYGADQKNTNGMEELHLMQIYGIFRKRDHTLYEVSPVLFQTVGIPEEFYFPDKGNIQKKLEEEVTELGKKKMDDSWDQLILKSGCTREQLIPALSREQICMTARRYLQMGKKSKDIRYLPRFSFEMAHGGFSDRHFLQYLNEEQKTLEELTEDWLCTHLSEISMKKIYYGCVKEEMEAMEKSRCSRIDNRNNFEQMQHAEKRSA